MVVYVALDFECESRASRTEHGVVRPADNGSLLGPTHSAPTSFLQRYGNGKMVSGESKPIVSHLRPHARPTRGKSPGGEDSLDELVFVGSDLLHLLVDLHSMTLASHQGKELLRFSSHDNRKDVRGVAQAAHGVVAQHQRDWHGVI